MSDSEIGSMEVTSTLIPTEQAQQPSTRPRKIFVALVSATLLITAAVVLAARATNAPSQAALVFNAGSPLQTKWIEWPPRFNDEVQHCSVIEENVDYQGTENVNVSLVTVVYDIGSPEMCCAACAGYPTCGAWTWGARRKTEFLTDVCWLKTLEPGAKPKKVANPNVTSGLPSRTAIGKHGVLPPPSSSSEKTDGLTPKSVENDEITAKCPGKIVVTGDRTYSLTNAGVNTPGKDGGKVETVEGDMIVPHMGGRTYFSEECQDGDYDHNSYANINLIGMRLRYTTDVSGTGCGCNAAFYLTSMRQNTKAGKCEDYYCDAMSVCGVPCGEIDIQEANQYSFFSTMHTWNKSVGEHGVADTLGVARGYGGSLGEPPRRDWTAEEYGPRARCIDTEKPFQVAISFPSDGAGGMEAMEIELSQPGRSSFRDGACTLNARSSNYTMHQGRDGLRELSGIMATGMTPIISYWRSKDMLWMDGLGADGRGPCVKDAPKNCPDYVRFYGFKLESLQ